MLPSSGIVVRHKQTSQLLSGLLPVLAAESGRGMLSQPACCRVTGSNRAKESKTWGLQFFRKREVVSIIKGTKK